MHRKIIFPDGREVKNIGQGSWYLGDNPNRHKDEIEALRAGIDAGLKLIDTAEMYGNGLSEGLIGEAIKPYPRDELFIVSKVLPSNAGEARIFEACEASLKRLGTDYLDLYLLHWEGFVPLQETIDCFEELKAQGRIKGWGVSNFDIDQMEELLALNNGRNCQTNQVLYHVASRGIEFSLTNYLKENNIPIMAYCPLIGQEPSVKRKFESNPDMFSIKNKHQITFEQLLLAFVTQQENVIAIPKSGSKQHVLENVQVFDLELDNTDMALIDFAFPAPQHKVPLHVE